MKMLYVLAVLTVTTITPCLCMNNTTALNVSIADNRTTLYIGALFNLDVNPDWGVLPMAQQAVEEVNSNPHILPGYRLQLVLNSTRGHLGFGQHVFQDYLNTGPRKIMLLGPADDAMAKSIASYAALPHVRLMQFSYGTSDLDLANRRDLYPYFFRTAASLASYDDPRIAMLKYYNWNEVGIVYGDSLLYMKLSNQFSERLKKKGVTVLAEVRLQSNDPTRAVRALKDRNAHVIFGMFEHGATARKLLCAAYKGSMHGPHYVWILLDSYNEGWWVPRSKDRLECDKFEMKCQIQNHFSFLGADIRTQKNKLVQHAQKNVSKITKDYYARVDSKGSTANRSSHAPNVHDAVWSIAMVLDKSRGKLHSLNKSLENVTHGDLEAVNIFYDETLKLNFPSLNMKNVKYFSNGDRNFEVRVNQLYLKDGRIRATSAGEIQSSKFTPSKNIRWFAGVPYKKTDQQFVYRTIDPDLFLALLVLASIGLLFALICCISVSVYMKRKSTFLKSGGMVSLLIILGCMLNYATVILYGFDYSRVAPEIVTKLCKVRPWIFSLGFSLSVGGLVAKLWIAYNVLSKRALMTKRKRLLWMLGLLLFLVVVDVAFLIWWELMDPLHREIKIVTSQPQYKCFEPITEETFKITSTVVETCSCVDLTLRFWILVAFKSLVLLFGAFLARQTRKIYIPSLDDTRQCGVCLFVACIFCAAGIVAALTTELYPTFFYGFIGGFIIFVTTFILGVLFSYQVSQLFCKPKPGHVICQCCVSCSDQLSLTCAKSCQCSSCCVTCWSWLGRCMCCGGPQDFPDSKHDSKLDYVIFGQPLDRNGRIVQLQNTIKERDEELKRLRKKRDSAVSAATQTRESTADDGRYENDGVHSHAETTKNNMDRQKFKSTARKVGIFSQRLDFSHVQSKVDSNVPARRTSLLSTTSGENMQYQYGKQENTAVKSSSSGKEKDEEVNRLKALLLQKDAEIQKLKKYIAGSPDTKRGQQGKVRAASETKPNIKIKVSDENTDSRSSMERKISRGSDSKKTVVPSQPTSVTTKQYTSKATMPEDQGQDKISHQSSPMKDKIPHRGTRESTADDGRYENDGVHSHAETTENNMDRQKFKSTARKVGIFNQKLDISHVQSKVDSNVQEGQTSLGLSVLSSTKPEEQGQDKSNHQSPPTKDKIPHRGTGTNQSSRDQAAEKEGRKISVITPASVWLLGGIRDRVVMSEEECKKVADENQQVDASFVMKRETPIEGKELDAKRKNAGNSGAAGRWNGGPADVSDVSLLVAAQRTENKPIRSKEYPGERKITTVSIPDKQGSKLTAAKEKNTKAEESNGAFELLDYCKSQSRLSRRGEVWKREPDFPVKFQRTGKQSYSPR